MDTSAAQDAADLGKMEVDMSEGQENGSVPQECGADIARQAHVCNEVFWRILREKRISVPFLNGLFSAHLTEKDTFIVLWENGDDAYAMPVLQFPAYTLGGMKYLADCAIVDDRLLALTIVEATRAPLDPKEDSKPVQTQLFVLNATEEPPPTWEMPIGGRLVMPEVRYLQDMSLDDLVHGRLYPLMAFYPLASTGVNPEPASILRAVCEVQEHISRVRELDSADRDMIAALTVKVASAMLPADASC